MKATSSASNTPLEMAISFLRNATFAWHRSLATAGHGACMVDLKIKSSTRRRVGMNPLLIRNATGASEWEPNWRVLVPLVLVVDVAVATLAWLVVSLFVG
jgi:hypothetical protein